MMTFQPAFESAMAVCRPIPVSEQGEQSPLAGDQRHFDVIPDEAPVISAVFAVIDPLESTESLKEE
jgi:hypothetical protein